MKRWLWLLALLCSTSLGATTYYVSCPASGTGDCLTAANACTFTDVWKKNATAGDTITAADGTYTGANCMIVPTHPVYATTTVSAGSGTMTAGTKSFAYTQTCGGVEGPLSVISSFSCPSAGGCQPKTFATNDRVSLASVTTSCFQGGTRTKATIYASKDERAAGKGDLYKVGTGCQNAFNDGATQSATCDPGPDSGWTSLPTLPGGGASGNPLTIKATNRGGVYIDGQYNNIPMEMKNGNSWLVIDGFKLAHAQTTPSATIIYNTIGAYNNIYQYIAAGQVDKAYAAGSMTTNNNANVGVSSNTTVDHAFFVGAMRKGFTNFSNFGNTYFINSVVVYGGSQSISPKENINMTYNTKNAQARDNILMWTLEEIPTAYTLKRDGCEWNKATAFYCPSGVCQSAIKCGDPYAAYTMADASYSVGPMGAPADTQAFTQYYGTIAIVRASDPPGQMNALFSGTHGSEVTGKDLVAFAGRDRPGVSLYNCPACPSPKNQVATNITEIGSVTGSIASDWTQTNALIHLADNSTFTYDGSSGASKANVCFQHDSSGTITAVKRFGNDPMEEIGYNFMALLGLTPLHYKTEVANALGAIPAACDNDAGGATPTPTNTPTQTFTPTNTFTPTKTFTPSPTNTPGGPPTPTPGGCLYWHPATVTGPGYFAYETCGLTWSHIHYTPTPIPE